jgi:hypothetical protein
MFDPLQEHLDFHYASDADWDREEAREKGAANPDQAWICTDRDVWHANPFYKGPKVPHPEDYDLGDLEVKIPYIPLAWEARLLDTQEDVPW